MDVLFFVPRAKFNYKAPWTPLGVFSIATYLKENGISVALVDRSFDKKTPEAQLAAFSPKIVCVSVNSVRSIDDAIRISLAAKNAGLPVIWGGFIATDSITANYIRHNARSSIFSASATPAAIGAVNASLDIMEKEPERIQHLWDITRFAIEGFRNMGCEIGNTSTPIIPLYIRDNIKTFQVTRELFDEGLFVNPVVSPAVPSEDTLIRFSLMATHTQAQVEYALETIEKVFKKYNII